MTVGKHRSSAAHVVDFTNAQYSRMSRVVGLNQRSLAFCQAGSLVSAVSGCVHYDGSGHRVLQ